MRADYSKRVEKAIRKAAKKDKLGFFEKIGIRIVARKDGRNAVPSLNEDDIFSSAFIQKEREAMGESLKELELDTVSTFEDKYTECDILIDSIPIRRREIALLEGETPPLLSEAESRHRKAGEEKLSDTQIHRRRLREHSTKHEGYYRNLASTKTKLGSDIEDLRMVANHLKILETEEITTDEKIFCHHVARVEYYWRLVHPIRAKKDSGFPSSVPISTMNLLKAEFEDYISELRRKRDHRTARVESVLKEAI